MGLILSIFTNVLISNLIISSNYNSTDETRLNITDGNMRLMRRILKDSNLKDFDFLVLDFLYYQQYEQQNNKLLNHFIFCL